MADRLVASRWREAGGLFSGISACAAVFSESWIGSKISSSWQKKKKSRPLSPNQPTISVDLSS
jgi:hypothetical protein